MASIGHSEEGAPRLRLYRSLIARNRLVAILRIGVPVIGLVVSAAVVLQLSVLGFMQQFGISGISIDRNNLVVQTPTYSGTGADGARYSVNALSARAGLTNQEIITLEQAQLTLTRTDGSSTIAKADTAILDTRGQGLDVTGTTYVSGSDGLKGTLENMHVDFRRKLMRADGAVDLTLGTGTQVIAHSMTFDDKAQLWSFSGATVTLPTTPGAAP